VSDHLSPGVVAPGSRRSGPAAYLDLAGQGRRSCLALHRAGFAWPPRHRGAGALLPHHFTFACTQLTCGCAIGRMFLWHCPADFPGWALPTASPYGVRTFLEGLSLPPQSLGPPTDGSAAGELETNASNILHRMPVAVVTGAGGGLGRAIAHELANRGYLVQVTDIDADAAARTAAEIGAGARPAGLDVRDEAACRAIAAEAATRGGSLDLWVNNAGILSTGLAWEQDETTRRAMLEVNAIGTMNGTVAALEPMIAAGKGHVINVISLAGIVAAPGEVNYSASKHAAMAFTLGTLFDLRRSGIKGIELSALCPDGIWTPMLEDKLDDPDAAGSFSGHLLTPERVATEVGRLSMRPRPVVVLPRWRGPLLRLFDLSPRLALRLLPWVMRDAKKRQRRYKKKIESGRWP
jgi:NAD(P)-dependent dehydrogenase (short-subunit alcohol dehydrogenase family)